MWNVNEWFEMNGVAPFLMGDILSWCDLVLASKAVEWAEVPRAGRWLEEAGRSGSDMLTTYRNY